MAEPTPEQREILKPSRICISPNDTLIVEWQRPGGYYLEMEWDPTAPKILEWMEADDDGFIHWLEAIGGGSDEADG